MNLFCKLNLNCRIMQRDLKEMISISADYKKARELYLRASEPLLNDTSNIKTLYEMFTELTRNMPSFPDKKTNQYRQRFIFIVMLFYSPRVLLTGEQIIRRKGIRDELSKTLKVCGSAISNNSTKIMFYYQHEKSFRSDIDYLYPEILLRAELMGLK